MGPAEPPLYLPSFWEKIFSKVTSPRSSKYFCMTLRMLNDRGAGVTQSPVAPFRSDGPCLEGHRLSSQNQVGGTAGEGGVPLQPPGKAATPVGPDH